MPVGTPKTLTRGQPSDASGYWAETWPIGAIFLSVDPANPATVIGFGTWVEFGSGRTLVGVDTGQTEFASVEQTGGEKTHTLTTSEMPSHTHVQDAHTHTLPVTTGTGLGLLGGGATSSAGITGSTTATNQTTGGDGAHNNLMPYIAIYMWKRTA